MEADTSTDKRGTEGLADRWRGRETEGGTVETDGLRDIYSSSPVMTERERR